MSYDYDIRELPIKMDFCRMRVERFLASNGLRLDEVESYVGIFDAQDNLVAGGGLSGYVIKCLAVDSEWRGEGLMNVLVSRLQAIAARNGHTDTMVYTKPENARMFCDLGYILLGRAPQAVLMESSPLRLERYRQEWSRAAADAASEVPDGQSDRKPLCGVCVINANPFTNGHRYLIEQAARRVQWLVVVVVSEDASAFPFSERMEMVRRGVSHIPRVSVVPSGPYAVSAATFPTYFLKNLSDASETQMRLDSDIFCRHVAPALGAGVRFVGTEPCDPLTRRYNGILRDELLRRGLSLVEIPRLDGISASQVRCGAWRDVPVTSLPYVLSHYACQALKDELDLTPKPGLVDREDSGAHTDMDYASMRNSINALRPYFTEICSTVLQNRSLSDGELLSRVRSVGKQAEQDMLRATGGVNTHGGALFSLGLTLCAFTRLYADGALETADDFSGLREKLRQRISRLAVLYDAPAFTHGSEVRKQYPDVCGALQNARAGFPVAMQASRPLASAADWHEAMGILLEIMSRLDDTNILYRSDAATLSAVKQSAARLLEEGFAENDIIELNRRFSSAGISPGGSADMLALSILVSYLCTPSVFAGQPYAG